MNDSLETKIRAAVHSVEPAPEFSAKLLSRINSTSRPAPKRVTRWFWIPASAVLAVALILIVAAPQSVMAAFRSLIAYLPGIGFVQKDDGTLYLQEPVSLEQDGVTLILEQVVADADKTVVSYHIDGLPENVSGVASPCFYDGNKLLLSDGTSRLPSGGGVENSQARVEFFPLPEGVTKATLLVSMMFPDPACSAPQEWKVDFSLDTTPPEGEFMPVFQSSPAVAIPSTAESVESPIDLIVDQVAALEDGYLLLGHIEWTDESWQNVRIDLETAFAQDAAGRTVPLEPTDEGSEDNAFAFKIAGKDFSAPLTLHVQHLLVWANVENSPTFSFAAGSDPQIGQSWDLNEELEIAGQKFTIYSVRAIQETVESDPGQMVKGYAIEVGNELNVNGFIWCNGQEETTESWGQTRNTSDTLKVLEMFYPAGLPFGQVTCRFQEVQFRLPGSWQIEWQPPAVAQ